MKKLVIASSAALLLTLSLTGCNTVNNGMNDVGHFANATVGTGIKYSAQTIGAGANLVANTGAAVGNGIGTVATVGTAVVTRPVTGMTVHHRAVPVHHKKVVFHNGHRYVWRHGHYVLVK